MSWHVFSLYIAPILIAGAVGFITSKWDVTDTAALLYVGVAAVLYSLWIYKMGAFPSALWSWDTGWLVMMIVVLLIATLAGGLLGVAKSPRRSVS